MTALMTRNLFRRNFGEFIIALSQKKAPKQIWNIFENFGLRPKTPLSPKNIPRPPVKISVDSLPYTTPLPPARRLLLPSLRLKNDRKQIPSLEIKI